MIGPRQIDARYAQMAIDVNHGAEDVFRACERRHAGAEAGPTWIDSRVLFGDKSEVLIRHGEQIYRLRITKQGKLLLNK